MCKRKVSNLFFVLFYLLLFFIISLFSLTTKVNNAKKENIRFYSYQVKNQFHRMNGVLVFTVVDSAKSVDRVRRSFVIDMSLSKIQTNFYLLSICDRQIVYWSYFCVY